MRKLVLVSIVGLLLLSVMLSAPYAAAEGEVVSGDFPDRVINVTRSGPGGPRTDTFWLDIMPTRSGNWSVKATSIAGSAVIVDVYEETGGILMLLGSSKLRHAGDESAPTPMAIGLPYKASFTPYGHRGTSVLQEQFTPASPPMACFTYTPAMPAVVDTITFDALCSSDPDMDIVSYAWDLGDGNTASGPNVTHTYAKAKTYAVTLNVTDSTGFYSTTTQTVVVAPIGLSVEWNFHDFFNVPYGEWWDMRTFFYGDLPIGAECFSAEGVANGYCVPQDSMRPDVATFPYTNWALMPTGDSAIYAPYRFDVTVQNSPAYAAAEPVILPTCEDLKAALAAQGITIVCPTPPATAGDIGIQETMQYLTTSRAMDLLSRGCPDLVQSSDGYLLEVQMTIRMDAAAAQRLFGVTDPAQWTPGTGPDALIKAGCGPGALTDSASGLLEQGLRLWLESQGNGPYDVSNALGSPYEVAAIEATGSYDMTTGEHVLDVMFVGWGHEVLSARWFYWGETPYTAGVAGAFPAGWSGMEVPWFEDLQMTGTIGTGFNATLSGVIQNHFRHATDPGENGIYDISDDVPKWVWAPALADRYYPSPLRPTSELGAYLGYSYVHTTVGSPNYGVPLAYDFPPALWALETGVTQTFQFPTSTVVLYNVTASPLFGNPAYLVPIWTPITFGYSVPGTGVGSFDPMSNVLTVVGPTTLDVPPLTLGGKPLESRPIYNLVAG